MVVNEGCGMNHQLGLLQPTMLVAVAVARIAAHLPAALDP